MNIFDKFFYIIYNSYYKHGDFKNGHPTWTVGGIFTFWLFALTLLLDFILITYSHNTMSLLPINNPYRYGRLEPSPAKFLGLIDFGIIYFFFFFRNRYNKIYEKYKCDEYLNSKKAKRIGYSVLILSFVSPFITPLIWHNF